MQNHPFLLALFIVLIFQLDLFGQEHEKNLSEFQSIKKRVYSFSKIDFITAEGEFNDKVACSAACTTGAIKFGDINEKDSEIYKLKNDDRAYHLLDAVGTKPNVVYQVKVRNTKSKV